MKESERNVCLDNNGPNIVRSKKRSRDMKRQRRSTGRQQRYHISIAARKSLLDGAVPGPHVVARQALAHASQRTRTRIERCQAKQA